MQSQSPQQLLCEGKFKNYHLARCAKCLKPKMARMLERNAVLSIALET